MLVYVGFGKGEVFKELKRLNLVILSVEMCVNGQFGFFKVKMCSNSSVFWVLKLKFVQILVIRSKFV